MSENASVQFVDPGSMIDDQIRHEAEGKNAPIPGTPARQGVHQVQKGARNLGGDDREAERMSDLLHALTIAQPLNHNNK
jgi:hypothetical protein